jgi:hypothetical protein
MSSVTKVVPNTDLTQQTIEATPGIENKQDNNLDLATQPNPCPTAHLKESTASRHT